MKKIIKKLINLVIMLLSLSIIFLAIYNFISVKILKNDYPNVFGYSFFEVISGSMEPTIDKGDFIFVKLTNKFKEDDIVTFKKDGVFITHRVIEIKEDIIVTRGDANNSTDNPVNREKIIGKVIKTIPKVGVWISIVTTPKIAFSIIISIILVYVSSYYFKNTKEEVKEKIIEEKREENDMVNIKKNYRLIIEIVILIILLIILAFLIPFTLSRFKTEARSDAKIDIAFYLLEDDYQYKNIKLEDILPGGTNYKYNFTVANFKDDERTEVKTEYVIEIVATTNLPLTYDLYMNSTVDSSPALSAVVSNTVEADDDGTYFRIIKTSSVVFDFTDDFINTYQLVVNFPGNKKEYKYQNISENIEIRVKSRQLLTSDN